MSSDQQKLTDALKTLKEHAQKSLPVGYQIQIQFSSKNHSVFVVDEDSEEVSDWPNLDRSVSEFDQACKAAVADHAGMLRLEEKESPNAAETK